MSSHKAKEMEDHHESVKAASASEDSEEIKRKRMQHFAIIHSMRGRKRSERINPVVKTRLEEEFVRIENHPQVSCVRWQNKLN